MLTLTLISALLSASPAAAAPEDAATAKAKAAFLAAKTLYKQARYAEAINKFEEAYALKPHPSIYFNIGKCHEQLGDTAKALRSYRDYLRLSPTAADAETVAEAVSNMERRLREKGVQQLLVFVEPANASIEVDGKSLGASPASIELTAGNHKMIVKAEGYETLEKSFVMQTARATEMTLNLAKSTPAITKVEPKPDEKKVVVTDVPKSDPKLTPTETKPPVEIVVTPETPKKGRVFTWVAAGVAVAAAGVGTGFGIANGATKEQLKMPHESPALENQLATQGTIANASFIGAGVAAAAAVVLLFVEGG